MKSSVLPYLKKLRTSGLSEAQKSYLSEVELQLRDIASSYIKELSSGYIGLSPCEIQVATLIKEGKSSKDIANLLNISLNTVLSHRYYIRIKTGLKGKKINLSAYLQTLK
jgi:DNA-binding CsgD family transcriptional regulator